MAETTTNEASKATVNAMAHSIMAIIKDDTEKLNWPKSKVLKDINSTMDLDKLPKPQVQQLITAVQKDFKLVNQQNAQKAQKQPKQVTSTNNGNNDASEVSTNEVQANPQPTDSVSSVAMNNNQVAPSSNSDASISKSEAEEINNLGTNPKDNNNGKPVKMSPKKKHAIRQRALAHKYHVNPKDMIDLKGSGIKQLEQMIGLKDVKNQIKQYIIGALVAKRAHQVGLHKIKMSSLNMIFMGAPGTGKTVVARLVGKILFQTHVIKKPLFHECSAKDLMSSLVNGSATKTANAIKHSLGGVLFVDEAYNLAPSHGVEGGSDSSKKAAVSELLRGAENHRNNLVVILAGYEDKMKDLIQHGNEGLKSRFNHRIVFPDYNHKEMLDILKLHAHNEGYNIKSLKKPEIQDSIYNFIDYAKSVHDDSNGRLMRNLLQSIAGEHVTNIGSDIMKIGHLTKKQISSITETDVCEGTQKALTEEENISNDADTTQPKQVTGTTKSSGINGDTLSILSNELTNSSDKQNSSNVASGSVVDTVKTSGKDGKESFSPSASSTGTNNK